MPADELDATRLERIGKAKDAAAKDTPPSLATELDKVRERLRATEEENARLHAELCGERRKGETVAAGLLAEQRKNEERAAREHLRDLRTMVEVLRRHVDD